SKLFTGLSPNSRGHGQCSFEGGRPKMQDGIQQWHSKQMGMGIEVKGPHLHPRNPFESPNPSTSSLNETDDGSTSGQDEFHLQRYSSNAKYQHLRQISQPTSNEEKDKKPGLAIITNFAGPKMPLKSEAIRINKVSAKQVRTDRKNKALSIVSHKATQSAASPPSADHASPRLVTSGLKKLQLLSKAPKHQTQESDAKAVIHKSKSRITQRIPIGITIPAQDAVLVEQNMIDSALATATPLTPAIVVTPAGDRPSIAKRRRSTTGTRRHALVRNLSAFSKVKETSVVDDGSPLTTTIAGTTKEMSQKSPDTVVPYSADTDRPQSQGWWNLMLSPLLRAGSLASRKGLPQSDTPPVPPVPFPSTKVDLPLLSAGSDASFLVSQNDTSPDTPRRQGLARIPGSTWSRWTEWEEEREANARNNSPINTKDGDGVDMFPVGDSGPTPGPARIGLAAEYFHACAVEQATGRPYFECVNHNCAERLPKLKSIHDTADFQATLASPFHSPNVQTRAIDGDSATNPTARPLEKGSVGARKSSTTATPSIPGSARIVDTEKDKEPASSGTPDADTKISRLLTEDEARKASVSSLDQTKTREQTTSPSIAATADKDLHSAAPTPLAPQIVELRVAHSLDTTLPTSQHTPEKAPAFTNDAGPVVSPGPMSPAGQKSTVPSGAIPLSEIEPKEKSNTSFVVHTQVYPGNLPGRPAFITSETEYPPLPDRVKTVPITITEIGRDSRRLSIEERRQRYEKEDATAKQIGGLWRGRGCLPNNVCMGRGGSDRRVKRRWIFGICLSILAIVIVSIILAVTLTRRGDGTPVDSSWLNLTGFPPIPIGILTIAAPNLVAQEKQCVAPTTMWSCSVPKDDRDQIGSNESDQPNFRFEVKFRNGTVPSNMTVPLSGIKMDMAKTSNDPFTNDLFVANPAPPNQPDQLFMGQSTDNITTPFDGADTPFYITFMSAFPEVPTSFNTINSKRLTRRQSNSTLGVIPAPALADDGSAAPASLLPTRPFPISQPIRLYNRGLQDEHYGFYMYYDKTIYLSNFRIDGESLATGSSEPAEADQNGGCLKSQANAVCTFAQTRFLFKIFTNPAFGAGLLPSSINLNATHPDDQKKTSPTSSATNFERPGSFPYPASIVLDRHGGDLDSKAVYCYGMENGEILSNKKVLSGELRSVGGQLVNAAPTLSGDNSSFNTTAGGIDGGTGGCNCNWQNWQ
ncbi:hypothetical protein LTS08_001059, partial [Lithohypha guttulata]